MATKEFIQRGPQTSDPYESDLLLKNFLAFKLPSAEFKAVDTDLKAFAERIDSECLQLAQEAESNPPRHLPYSAWGERVDEIETSFAWKKLDQISAEEGLIALGYERQGKTNARLHQFAKLYLFHPASAFYTCPLAMTDGAAKLIETHQFKAVWDAFLHITSRDPKAFWTSGQWMTERSGGSDVSRSETVAKLENGKWKLYGTKWFTSATTSQLAMTLARIVDEKGETVAGSRGLSLFCVKVRDENEKLNNIEILRLKDKLGTKALPTAELKLVGTEATLLGQPGEGVKTIATLFNVTRIYNACTTIGSFRHLLNLARDYSSKREAFKKPIADWTLHQQLLADAEVEFAGLFMLTFATIELLGQEESAATAATEREDAAALLRLLTPIAKLMTAKRNMIWTSELIESFGGAGYIEDTGLPKWLRDSQVFPIWEGTTNVLSLDVLRALSEERSMTSFSKRVNSVCHEQNPWRSQLQARLSELQTKLPQLSRSELENNARRIAFYLGETMALTVMMEFALRAGATARDKTLVHSYLERAETKLDLVASEQLERNKIINQGL